MRLAFLGTPDFAVPSLLALHEAGHEIGAVYCQPPRPAGRGKREKACPVHEAAARLGLPVRTPSRLRGNEKEAGDFNALRLDAAIVAAYGLILPGDFLRAPQRGCLNVHASLLPRWRGASPIQAAILAGDQETGITIMQMDEGLDTGPILLMEREPIRPDDTGSSLHDRLAPLGANLALRALAENPLARPQPEEGATYAPRLTRQDACIDWREPAEAIERRVRAFTPWPGTETVLGGTPLKIVRAELADGHGAPGTVLDKSFTIACGRDALRLLEVQRPGGRKLDAAAFLRGHAVPAGTVLG